MNDPIDSSFDLENPDTVAALDEISLWSAPFGLKLLEAVRYRQDMSVLDIGFGTGFPLLELAMRLGDGSRIFGIDPWTAAVERTRAKMIRYGIDNVKLIIGRGEEIPLPDASVDLIVSNNGINNVDDLDRVLAECSRVSKAGAQFLATMNLDTTMMEFYSVLEEVLSNRDLVAEIGAMKQHIRKKRQPLIEVRRLLETNRFTVRNVVNDTFRYTFANGSAMFRHFFIRLAFFSAWNEIVPEPMRSDVFGEIEQRLNERAVREGCVHLTVPYALIECERIGGRISTFSP